jgi:hypothetical protein
MGDELRKFKEPLGKLVLRKWEKKKKSPQACYGSSEMIDICDLQ